MHEQAARVVAAWESRNKRVAAFLQRARANAAGQDIQSLLIEPIQRVPRYEMLLKAMLAHTEKRELMHETLHRACTAVHKVAASMDLELKEFGVRMQIIKIQVRRAVYASRCVVVLLL